MCVWLAENKSSFRVIWEHITKKYARAAKILSVLFFCDAFFM